MSTNISNDLTARGVAQVIVVLHEGAGGGAAAAAAAASDKRAEGLSRHFVSSELSRWSAVASSLRASGKRVTVKAKGMSRQGSPTVAPVRYYPNLGILFGTVDRSGLSALRASQSVRSVSGSPALSPIRPTRIGAAKLSSARTWGLESLGIPTLWAQGLTGKGVLVGHLDTGVDGKHPALKGAIAHFAEFDSLGRIVTPGRPAHDTDEHGTHTAATIAGRAVSGKSVGVAPGAKLVSAIVIEGGDVVARVLGGLDWALGQGVRVISMSLGLRGWFDDFRPLTRILRAHGVLPVFAVGNEGPGTSRSPGNYAEALSVGAHDKQKRIADFSSSQRFARSRDPLVPDLAAPGVDVISAKPGGGYQSMDGTSMATPHVAGLAALLLEAVPGATVNTLESAIFRSCALPSTMTRDRANRGVPAAVKALQILGG